MSDASDKSARISVLLSPELRDAFFDYCRRLSPRRSMSERLVEHIMRDLGRDLPIGSSKPRRTPRLK